MPEDDVIQSAEYSSYDVVEEQQKNFDDMTPIERKLNKLNMMKQILDVMEKKEHSVKYKKRRIDSIIDRNIKSLSEDEMRIIINDIKFNKF